MYKRRGSKIWVIAMLGVFLYFGYTMFRQQEILYAKRSETERLQSKIHEVEKLNESLKEQREILGSDEYIEEVARERLGMVQKGERVFVDINK